MRGGNTIEIIAEKKAKELILRANEHKAQVKTMMEGLQNDNAKLSPHYEQFMIKSEDSLKEKILTRLNEEIQTGKQLPSSEVPAWVDKIVMNIGDYLRFTYIIDKDNYVSEVVRIVQTLKKKEFECLKFKPEKKDNRWELGDYYQGINTVYKCRDLPPIEIQFHTPDSIHIKEDKIHPIYEEWRKIPCKSRQKNIIDCERWEDDMLEYEKQILIPTCLFPSVEYT